MFIKYKIGKTNQELYKTWAGPDFGPTRSEECHEIFDHSFQKVYKLVFEMWKVKSKSGSLFLRNEKCSWKASRLRSGSESGKNIKSSSTNSFLANQGEPGVTNLHHFTLFLKRKWWNQISLTLSCDVRGEKYSCHSFWESKSEMVFSVKRKWKWGES